MAGVDPACRLPVHDPVSCDPVDTTMGQEQAGAPIAHIRHPPAAELGLDVLVDRRDQIGQIKSVCRVSHR